MTEAPNADARSRNTLVLVVLGAAVGLCSGLFGVGGGVLVVPVLTFLMRYPIKLASGTSLLAILVPAAVGVVTYGINGNVHVLMALLLAVGSVLGAPVGSRLLAKMSPVAVQWSYVVFLLGVIASMFFPVPERGTEVVVDVVGGVLLLLTGFVAGIAGGLLGIGGGMVVVPILMLGFGASDLVAKGTSLLMIIATSLSGTFANARRQNVDVRAALTIGLAAAVVTPFSVLLLRELTPFAANMAFAGFVAVLVARMLLGIWQEHRRDAGAAADSK